VQTITRSSKRNKPDDLSEKTDNGDKRQRQLVEVEFEDDVDEEQSRPFNPINMKVRATVVKSRVTDFNFTVDPERTEKDLDSILKMQYDKLVIGAGWSNLKIAGPLIEKAYELAKKRNATITVITGYDFVTADFKGNMNAQR
jgi:hypothetical protein